MLEQKHTSHNVFKRLALVCEYLCFPLKVFEPQNFDLLLSRVGFHRSYVRKKASRIFGIERHFFLREGFVVNNSLNFN